MRTAHPTIPRPLPLRRPRFISWLASFTTLLALASSAFAAAPSPSDLMRMNQAASDTAGAAQMIPNIRAMLANAPDSNYAGRMRQMLIRALVNSKAPGNKIAAAADSALPYLAKEPERRVAFLASVSQVLAERKAALPKAMEFARRASFEVPDDDVARPLQLFVHQNLGFVHWQSGNTDSAIHYFERVLPLSPDSMIVLRQLGDAYQKKGNPDAAINAYLRSLAVFPVLDTTSMAPLRKAYLKKHGSLAGLDADLSAARKESRQRVALDPRRMDSQAPEWSLADFDGNMLDSKSLAGKILVVDFWGSWCGPCRRELPIFEALYQRYKGNDRIRFLGINWERNKQLQIELARDYMKQNNLTFPNVIDPEQTAVNAFGIQGFPTVFLIDANGRMRYRNIGVAEDIEQILEAQIESLLLDS